MEIIYHDWNESESPFLETLIDIFDEKDVMVACPYINRKILSYLISRADNIKIVSDVVAWLESCSPKERGKTIEFINTIGDRLHHCPKLHAKVFFNESKSLIGSANLTNSGMLRNIEISVVLNDSKKLDELRQWFKKLWDITEPLDCDNMNEINNWKERIDKDKKVKQSNELNITNDNSPIISGYIPTKLRKYKKQLSKSDEEVLSRIKKVIDLFPSLEWFNEFLDIWEYILEYFDIQADDQRITLSVPNAKDKLAMTVGQRYVATGFTRGKIALIMPINPDIYEEDKSSILKKERFTNNEKLVCNLYYFKTNSPKKLFKRYKTQILNLIKYELQRTEVSGYKRYHEDILYHIAIDRIKRIELLKD
ncbi:MAG: phospholipase D-like domain-containing protein [Bacillota bacterium]